MERLGWRVWEGGQEIFDDMVEQAKSDSGQDPEKTVLFLITKDPDFADLIGQLQAEGVQVYLMAPWAMSNQLPAKIGDRFSIQWWPTMVDSLKR